MLSAKAFYNSSLTESYTECSDRSDSDRECAPQDSYHLKKEQCGKIYEQIFNGTNLSQLNQQLANFNLFDMLASSCAVYDSSLRYQEECKKSHIKVKKSAKN